MQKLSLLFTKDGLQWHISKGKSVLQEASFFITEETSPNLVEEKLDEILSKDDYKEINVFSALNHFSLTPDTFAEHELGYQLISYNAPVNEENEELMLSVNKKFGVQFYYTFPKKYYQKIKSKKLPTKFNFSGEKFLNSIQVRNSKEIHINLYHHQVEFFAFENKKVVLYNNLDADSEVDFLYFIMFSLSKINFGTAETHFHIYGETHENETFISELRKFVKNIKVHFDNAPKKNFVLS
jgi:hypothetical protein